MGACEAVAAVTVTASFSFTGWAIAGGTAVVTTGTMVAKGVVLGTIDELDGVIAAAAVGEINDKRISI